MNVAATPMRAIDDLGEIYAPYSLDGAFTPTERKTIEAAIKPHVPERVGATFNEWRIAKISNDYFTMKRFTWGTSLGGKSAEEIAEKLSAYYERQKKFFSVQI